MCTTFLPSSPQPSFNLSAAPQKFFAAQLHTLPHSLFFDLLLLTVYVSGYIYLLYIYIYIYTFFKETFPNHRSRTVIFWAVFIVPVVTAITTCHYFYVQFSCSVVSDSLQPHGLQHVRPHCPSPTPGACSNSCPSSQWCHPTISSSVIPFSSCLQSFPASGSFQMSQFFTSGGQSIGVSASASVLPMNIQDWFPLGWTGLISLPSKGLLQHHSSKASILQHSAFFIVQLYTKTWLLEKP